jgi:2-keto-4-pentenoate hydratase/2-oxohepta-3-ene-1,7-dioic acid hydratase in catechol pathway
MRLVRARIDGSVVLGRLEGDSVGILATESDHPRADVLIESLDTGLDLSAAPSSWRTAEEVTVLSPVRQPGKIVCVGLNYRAHAAESGRELPERPLLFAKFANAVVGPDEPIVFSPDDQHEVDYEGELAVVIGSRTSHVAADQALGHVLGYTVANDVSGRHAQFLDGQWLRGKSHDTFCPLGPELVTADEISDVQRLQVTTRLNGEVMQDGSTADMVFSVTEIISYVSRFIALEPGDVVLTGTPPGVGFARTPPVYLGDGDVVEVTISGLGTLRSPVAAG